MIIPIGQKVKKVVVIKMEVFYKLLLYLVQGKKKRTGGSFRESYEDNKK